MNEESKVPHKTKLEFSWCLYFRGLPRPLWKLYTTQIKISTHSARRLIKFTNCSNQVSIFIQNLNFCTQLTKSGIIIEKFTISIGNIKIFGYFILNRRIWYWEYNWQLNYKLTNIIAQYKKRKKGKSNSHLFLSIVMCILKAAVKCFSIWSIHKFSLKRVCLKKYLPT